MRWACQGELARRQGRIQQALLSIQQWALQETPPENVEQLWDRMGNIREEAKNILGMIEPRLTWPHLGTVLLLVLIYAELSAYS